MKRRLTHDLAALSGTAYRARYNRDEMKAHAKSVSVNRNRLFWNSSGFGFEVSGLRFRVSGLGFEIGAIFVHGVRALGHHRHRTILGPPRSSGAGVVSGGVGD